MKRVFALIVALLLMIQIAPVSVSAKADDDSATPPISSGTINKVTYIYWGKSELFPTLALVGPGTKLDVYEYDKNWVLVLYDTYVSQGYSGSAHSFYGYVKRSDITCDPALEGDASDKADTGPGKRKGKKPKPKNTAAATADATQPQSTAEDSASPNPSESPAEEDEYDWIIRTPGLCNVTVYIDDTLFTCSFALMAQKFGGTAPSSHPGFNKGVHTPYVATGFYGMVSTMQDMLEGMGVSGFLTGMGGISIEGQAAGEKFYIDTATDNFALVNFTLKLQATGTLNPKITDGNITADAGSTTINQTYPLPVQLKKVGNGYKFVLPGMKPGGGNLEFPAVLEKTFSDPNREAKEEDARRKRAEDLRKKVLEKIKEQMRKELEEKEKQNNEDGSSTTDPLTVPGEDGEDIPLAPLVTPDPDFTPAPLVPEDPLAPLVPSEDEDSDFPLAPLVPSEGEQVSDFPSQQP